MKNSAGFQFLGHLLIWGVFLAIFGIFGFVSPASALTLDEIIEKVEKRYSGQGFSAQFFQVSTLKAMQISETASGKLFVKRPGKMRWEYETPDKQTIITDGKTLWIHRPDDNQVMVGRAPSFFGDGKGAGFLSDINRVRQNFEITLEAKSAESNYVLKLVPNKQSLDISSIYLAILPSTFDAVQVITYNQYEDETRITLTRYAHNQDLPDNLFSLQIPEGADVVNIDQYY